MAFFFIFFLQCVLVFIQSLGISGWGAWWVTFKCSDIQDLKGNLVSHHCSMNSDATLNYVVCWGYYFYEHWWSDILIGVTPKFHSLLAVWWLTIYSFIPPLEKEAFSLTCSAGMLLIYINVECWENINVVCKNKLKGVTLHTGIVQSTMKILSLQLPVAIDFHSMKKLLWKSMATVNHLVIKISSFVLNRRNKFIQAWNKIY